MKHKLAWVACGFATLVITIGCATGPARVDRGTVDPTTRPANVRVRANDFDPLWAAADRAARDLLFMPARQDRRAGLYRTEPMVSAQWFEPWRREVRTADDRARSSLASMRRTLSVQVTRDANGGFAATPTVLVERYALTERRVTTAAGYKTVFRDRGRGAVTSAETDAGLAIPDSYWYPDGNDPVLERYVAQRIEDELAKGS